MLRLKTKHCQDYIDTFLHEAAAIEQHAQHIWLRVLTLQIIKEEGASSWQRLPLLWKWKSTLSTHVRHHWGAGTVRAIKQYNTLYGRNMQQTKCMKYPGHLPLASMDSMSIVHRALRKLWPCIPGTAHPHLLVHIDTAIVHERSYLSDNDNSFTILDSHPFTRKPKFHGRKSESPQTVFDTLHT